MSIPDVDLYPQVPPPPPPWEIGPHERVRMLLWHAIGDPGLTPDSTPDRTATPTPPACPLAHLIHG